MERKERPILFSAPMVRAILEGRKTQTRRVIKSVAGMGPVTEFQPSDTPGYDFIMRDKRMLWNDLGLVGLRQRCPHGGFGDRLWVRETWGQTSEDTVCYRADEPHSIVSRWRPSIHMPRWASRINLEITGIRVEQLQDISNTDARAEGVGSWPEYVGVNESGSPKIAENFIDPFRRLWHDINGEKSWNANPWAWVIEFKKC